jgi:hypothetical protein
VDRLAHAVIVAEAVFGERSIDLVGEPQWIVAIILGISHSCCSSRISPPFARFMTNGTGRERLPAKSLNYRLIDDGSECNFLDNRKQKYQLLNNLALSGNMTPQRDCDLRVNEDVA